MLRKEFRITKENEFKRIYQKGKFFGNGEYTVRSLPNRSSFSRVAVVILKKHTKKATKRNLARRRLQEIVRLNFAKLRPGFDLIITSKRDLAEVEYQNLEKSLLALLNRGNLLKYEKDRSQSY
ncbi:MAG: Ribonuclease P protein component [candidate division CPR2 bacterium GW2011_GWC1_41_48]|uniref:Ribonuclease P protein component n=1 Tax=candidate division CPR2 bacterium GW2011_GWC1_41_48 TaxID=1618344 RepID=A0A0G0YIP2_UNCC2|nr:MAG: Ribonuclease P protein component [candidate division CPR2 bacterium GW2011_GWC2_39_35]KKR27967.1 MAG: Ribonuclease P protein component [candidate division CPR2 bacterium GW2011_GWD2_39_7]KKS09426.1 MAG: Ribonuclease P protein component [candidate division CPR2 bacterium GW2011_GWC1_41_48]OGB72075.1 MAG: ribonuclease P protein component [candidate division CPR2 bacterium GWD2_39_7]